jgi:ribonuclease HI
MDLYQHRSILNVDLLSMLSLDYEIPWFFFYGANQGHPHCGVGVVLHLNSSHFFHIRYALEIGSNMNTEFAALWTLLHHAKHLSLTKLQVLGDSKVVIDRVKDNLKI